jgi:amino acid adenylation domain-containing protein
MSDVIVTRLLDSCLFSGAAEDEAEAIVEVPLSAGPSAAIERVSRETETDSLTVLAAAVSLLLHRYHGGGPVGVDLFANTAGWPGTSEQQSTPLLVVPLHREHSLRGFLREVRGLVSEACARSGPGTGQDAAGAADVIVRIGARIPATAHDMAVCLALGDRPVLRVGSPSGQVPAWFRRDFAAQLDALLGLFADTTRPVACVDAVVRTRADATVRGFNQTERAFATDTTVLRLFREQVRIRPEADAVISVSGRLSFAGLHRAAVAAAQVLREELGVSRGDVVAVLAERDSTAVLAVLAVMEAGAVYLPLHPEWPADKKARVLKEADARALLLHPRHTGDGLPPNVPPTMTLQPGEPAATAHKPGSDSPQIGRAIAAGHVSGPDETAYVVFTSGSTGLPKGVVLAHRGLANTTLDHIDRFGIGPDDRYLQFMAVSFDGFLLDVFSTLCAGAALVIADAETIRDPARFIAWAREHHATISTITPSYLRLLDPAQLSGLRVLVSAGEAITPALAGRLARHTVLYNGYGPTEATVNSTLHRHARDWRGTSVPIGAPSANKQIYVLDERREQQPPGVCGEICIAGEGIASGYLNDAELTRQKFVPNPYPGGPRLYRTGDYGTWTPDGELLFRGREDQQVKVNGYRIDLRELEDAARSHPAVDDCLAVLVTSDRGRTDVAFFLRGIHGAGNEAEAEVRAHLDSRIARYMHPRWVAFVDGWPLTPHGKTDIAALRALLPRGGDASGDGKKGLVTTTTVPGLGSPVERTLAGVWRGVLGVGEVDLDASFHSLGGDSLRVIEVVRAAGEAGLSFTVQDLLREQTVRKLARYVTSAPGLDMVPAPTAADGAAALTGEERAVLPASAEDAFPAAHMQSLMIERYAADTTLNGDYLGCAEWTFEDDELDEDSLVAALRRLFAAHPALRLAFRRTASGRDIAVVRPPAAIHVERLDHGMPSRPELDAWFAHHIESETARRFDPYGDEPLIRFQLHRTGARSCSIFVSFHHALLDGWSGIELRNALLTHYRDAKAGRPALPVPAGHSVYREFVALERELVADGPARDFWRAAMSSPRTREAVASVRRALTVPWPGPRVTEETALPAPVMAAVVRHAGRTHVTVKAVLLTAAAMAVAQAYGGLPSLAMSVVTNGRSERLTEPFRSTGLFWNMVPVAISTRGAQGADARVQRDLDALAPYGAFPLRVIETELLGEPLATPVFNFVNFRNAAEGAGRFAEGVVQSRFHFPLTFFVKFTDGPDGPAARLRIDADQLVLGRRTAADLRDLVLKALTHILEGNQ